MVFILSRPHCVKCSRQTLLDCDSTVELYLHGNDVPLLYVALLFVCRFAFHSLSNIYEIIYCALGIKIVTFKPDSIRNTSVDDATVIRSDAISKEIILHNATLCGKANGLDHFYDIV